MNTYIALFRGINVGGHNRLLMQDLRDLMNDLGYQNVNTYIQTGNMVFEAEDPDLESLMKYKKESERFELMGLVFYLHAPDGIGRSKLAGKTGKALGVSMTGHNWRAVQKIMEMVEDMH